MPAALLGAILVLFCSDTPLGTGMLLLLGSGFNNGCDGSEDTLPTVAVGEVVPSVPLWTGAWELCARDSLIRDLGPTAGDTLVLRGEASYIAMGGLFVAVGVYDVSRGTTTGNPDVPVCCVGCAVLVVRNASSSFLSRSFSAWIASYLHIEHA